MAPGGERRCGRLHLSTWSWPKPPGYSRPCSHHLHALPDRWPVVSSSQSPKYHPVKRRLLTCLPGKSHYSLLICIICRKLYEYMVLDMYVLLLNIFDICSIIMNLNIVLSSKLVFVPNMQMWYMYKCTYLMTWHKGSWVFHLVDAWMKSAKVGRMQQSSCLCSNGWSVSPTGSVTCPSRGYCYAWETSSTRCVKQRPNSSLYSSLSVSNTLGHFLTMGFFCRRWNNCSIWRRPPSAQTWLRDSL